ncbi:MAG: winged helix-turn-helix domain-containing protein, partial [Vicinamibacterales bacterium]
MEQLPGEPRGYRFGVFELDVRSGELRRRGLKVRLRGRPVDILLVLLNRRGELVSREELRTELWTTDTFVDFDHGLNSAMNKLRDVLGDAADRSRYIETVPRRGYRFVAPVEFLTEAPAPAANAPAGPAGAPVPPSVASAIGPAPPPPAPLSPVTAPEP